MFCVTALPLCTVGMHMPERCIPSFVCSGCAFTVEAICIAATVHADAG